LGIAVLRGAFSGFCASRIGYEVQNVFDDEEHWHNCAYDVPLEEEQEPASDNQGQDYGHEHEEEYEGKENIN